MAKYIAFTIYDSTDKSCEVTGAVECTEQIDALSFDQIKSAIAFGLASEVTGLRNMLVDMVDNKKSEQAGE